MNRDKTFRFLNQVEKQPNPLLLPCFEYCKLFMSLTFLAVSHFDKNKC